jgi:hypothetical protein
VQGVERRGRRHPRYPTKKLISVCL